MVQRSEFDHLLPNIRQSSSLVAQLVALVLTAQSDAIRPVFC